jgi:hypothetical protein
MSVVHPIVGTRSSGPPASQPVSCLTRLSADLSVIWLRVCFILFVVCFVYQNKPRTTEALKANVTEEIQAVTANVLAQGFSRMWCAEFNPVWTKMVATSSMYYDVITYLIQ